MQDQDSLPLSGKGFLARIYWMFLGNVALFFPFVHILEKRSNPSVSLDMAFGLTALSLDRGAVC